ncbi:unnamed protein product, partial [Mesorhabditis spiculigera]
MGEDSIVAEDVRPEAAQTFFPLKFLLYLLYRIVRTIILLESDFVAAFKRLCTCECCDVEFLHILTRFRLDPTDRPNAVDFLAFHDGFGDFSEILHPDWLIYDIDDTFVYLAKLPDTSHLLTADTCCRMGDELFASGEKLARVRLETFIERSGRLPPFASRVVFLHLPPCSGGTTVARMLQACDPTYQNLCVYGEPPVTTSLACLIDELPVELLKRLTLATLRHALHHQKNDQTIVYKCRFNSGRLIPFIHATVPSVLHCLVGTRAPDIAVSKLMLRAGQQTNFFQIISRMREEFRWISDKISSWPQMQLRAVQQVGPKDAFEMAAALFIGSQLVLERCLPYLAIDPICFEELMSDTARLFGPLADLCELTDLHIPEAIAWKRSSSHEWRDNWDLCILDERQLRRLEQLHELLLGDWSL